MKNTYKQSHHENWWHPVQLNGSMPYCYTSRTAGCERKKYARKNIVGVMPSRLNHLAPDCDAHAQQLRV